MKEPNKKPKAPHPFTVSFLCQKLNYSGCRSSLNNILTAPATSPTTAPTAVPPPGSTIVPAIANANQIHTD